MKYRKPIVIVGNKDFVLVWGGKWMFRFVAARICGIISLGYLCVIWGPNANVVMRMALHG